jgi:NADH-quinone oxidoreductase subunit E
MKRYDLRHLHDDFYDRMVELIEKGLQVGEVGIFMFEVGDFSSIQKSADVIRSTGHDLMNSLKYNEVDWTIVVKKVSDEIKNERKDALANAAQETENASKEATEEA